MTVIREALVNDGTAAHSERALRYFSMAILCRTFDVRCIHDTTGKCTFDERGMSLEAIAHVVPKLRHRNVNGSGVFIRPCRPFAFADDVQAGALDRMLDDGQRIAAVIETSPESFQVWVPLAGPLRTINPTLCAAACDHMVELYATDPGVAHRDSFGRAPGFRNRKPVHERDGKSPLVTMSNQHSGFKGYDRVLLEEARRIVANQPKPLGKRSAGPVLTTPDDLGPIEVWQGGDHVATFSAVSTGHLFEQWLAHMQTSGYSLPQRPGHSETDRSQRDLDVLRSMHTAGVPYHTAEPALAAGSDKAQKRGEPYIRQLMSAVWGDE